MEVIRLDRVSLLRRTQEEFSYNLKKTLLSWLEGKYRKPAKRLVLDQVDLAIAAGEKFGIIGANGSGKSTLLKVICSILEPTSGQVRVRGNIAPLIELGAGFDTEISVADNIILYGVMLGFSEKEMRSRTPEILAFAELEDYSTVPVKALSSGMVARLGFAIATEVQPDILILDEVLSVGDESFKNKCKQRIERFWQANSTVLLVSHDLEFIRKSCQRALWLDHGKVHMLGEADTVIESYIDNFGVKDKSFQPEKPRQEEKPIPLGQASIPQSTKSNHVTATSIAIRDQNKQITTEIPFGSPFYISLDYQVLAPIEGLSVGFYLTNESGMIMLEPVSFNFLSQTEEICQLGSHQAYVKIPGPLLKPGTYFITQVGLHEFHPPTRVFTANHAFTTHHLVADKLVEFKVIVGDDYYQEWFGQEVVHPILEWEIESRGGLSFNNDQ